MVWLVWAPPSTDLAAQAFRTELFSEYGLVLWNNAWYGGHHTLGYSVLFPPLAALLGVRLAGALAAVAAALLFAELARRRFGPAGRAGALWFAAGIAAWLFTGRLTFMLGVTVALAALVAAERRRLALTIALSALTSLASPVAGLFLGIAGVALGLAHERTLGAAVALPAGAVMIGLNLAFPTEGTQPYPFTTFVAIPVFALLALWLVPRDQRVIRVGIALYALFAIAVYVIPTPVGSNVARLGALFAGPLAALLLYRRPALLAAVTVPLLWWQLASPVEDLDKALGDPASERAYYEPLLAELDRQMEGEIVRVQIPPTENRWEAAYVAPRYPLARGWLRQLESEDFDVFTDDHLTEQAYREWLREHGVGFVAVPDASVDYLSEDEVELVDNADFLRLVWQNEHWRLYEVAGDTGIARGGARVTALGPDWFELEAPSPGRYPVSVRYTRLWSVAEGDACVGEGTDEWTQVVVRTAGEVRVEADPTGDRCARR